MRSKFGYIAKLGGYTNQVRIYDVIRNSKNIFLTENKE